MYRYRTNNYAEYTKISHVRKSNPINIRNITTLKSHIEQKTPTNHCSKVHRINNSHLIALEMTNLNIPNSYVSSRRQHVAKTAGLNDTTP